MCLMHTIWMAIAHQFWRWHLQIFYRGPQPLGVGFYVKTSMPLNTSCSGNQKWRECWHTQTLHFWTPHGNLVDQIRMLGETGIWPDLASSSYVPQGTSRDLIKLMKGIKWSTDAMLFSFYRTVIVFFLTFYEKHLYGSSGGRLLCLL